MGRDIIHGEIRLLAFNDEGSTKVLIALAEVTSFHMRSRGTEGTALHKRIDNKNAAIPTFVLLWN